VDYAFRLYDAIHLRGAFRPCYSHIVFLVLARMLVTGQSITLSPTSQAFSTQTVSTACSANAVALKNGSPSVLTMPSIGTSWKHRAGNAFDIFAGYFAVRRLVIPNPFTV
jgi:hypothetical protein